VIIGDQPTCFPESLLVRVSSRGDGTVLDRAVGIHNPDIVTNRTKFCGSVGVDYGGVVYQRINYGPLQTYDRIVDVDARHTCAHIDEVAADALVTDAPEVGLLLPVADCVATVIYDEAQGRLSLAHLGRHSTLAGLMGKTLSHMAALGSQMKDLTIWMAPSVAQANYRMAYFDSCNDPDWTEYCEQRDGGFYLDLAGYNRARAIDAGVPETHIHISPIDTATNPEYFSHSQGERTDRFAVLAVMRTRDTNSHLPLV
jgi:copper oxidase (laccase) domain-containing protein